MGTLITDNKLKDINICPKLKRQTHMYCTLCNSVAEYYDQKYCDSCGKCRKWSIKWKNQFKN